MRISEIVVSGLGGSSIALNVSSLGGVSIGGTSEGSGVPSRSAWASFSCLLGLALGESRIELGLVGGDQLGAAETRQGAELGRALGHLESVGDRAVRARPRAPRHRRAESSWSTRPVSSGRAGRV